MRSLIVVRGLPGSGKSHKAKKIALMNNFNKVTIRTTDDFFMVDGEYVFDHTKIGLYHQMNQDQVMKDMEDNTNLIIVPNTFTVLWEFQKYIKLCQTYNYSMIITESDAEWKFDVDECHNRNTHGVPLDTIEAMKSRWVSSYDIFSSISKENTFVKVMLL